MIIVHGTFPVKPEVRNDALEVMRHMAIASRAEPGCITYEFYIGLSDMNTLLLFQEWESFEALEDHFQTDHMGEFVRLLPDFLSGEIFNRRYEVREAREELEESPDVEGQMSHFEPREIIIH